MKIAYICQKIFILIFSGLAFLKNISTISASDSELVQQYKSSGDLKVVGELYQRYMELIYGVCLKYLKHPENAQDSVITIFEDLIGKLKKHDVQNFKSWLYTLAKNHCLMRLRSEKKQSTIGINTEFMQSEEDMHLNGVLEKEENFKIMEYCLEQLQADQKKAIELFYLENKCYNEITNQTGLDYNKVRSHIQNGRRNLKLCMEAQVAKTEV